MNVHEHSIAAAVKELLPHQDRVVVERLQLTEKVNKLEAFVMGANFVKLPKPEQGLLTEQLEHMVLYLQVLDRRVAAYTGAKRYTCFKDVLARPMNRGDYNALRDWTVPSNENPTDPGYLIELLDGAEGNHPDFAGYITWSSKEAFERSYKETK